MKKIFFTLIALLTFTAQANAMSYEQARNEALFLTDKMAYELNLTDAQYEAAYEINLDYLMSVTSQYDVFGLSWERRNRDLEFILYGWQWDVFRAATYFFRPLYWEAGFWHFGIYARYPHRDYFYFGRPHFYASYRGAHSWRMNGGRSYYEGHRDHFRPGHSMRDTHVGMRNGWERGDYRNSVHGGSSTRVTAGGQRGDRRPDGIRNDDHGSSSFGGSRPNGSNRSGNFDGNRSTTGSSHSSGTFSGTRPSGSHSSGRVDGNRSSSSSSHGSSSFGGGRPSSSQSSGSYSGNRSSSSSSHGSSSFGGTRPSSSHSSGSFSGSHGSTTRSSGGATHSSSGGSRNGGSRR